MGLLCGTALIVDDHPWMGALIVVLAMLPGYRVKASDEARV